MIAAAAAVAGSPSTCADYPSIVPRLATAMVFDCAHEDSRTHGSVMPATFVRSQEVCTKISQRDFPKDLAYGSHNRFFDQASPAIDPRQSVAARPKAN